MLALEIYGRIEKEYGPTIGCKTRIEGLSPKDVCSNILEFRKLIEEGKDLYWIKVYVNGKFVSPDFFLERHKSLWQKRPNLKIYLEFGTDKFVLMDVDTGKDVFVGGKWECEKYLDEQGYFSDDKPNFV
jgi:hypothetical protein